MVGTLPLDTLQHAHIVEEIAQQLVQGKDAMRDNFGEGYRVIRGIDRYWVGLSVDMIIEQVLMRSLKTTGVLTRGSGITESQRLVWLLSTPASA